GAPSAARIVDSTGIVQWAALRPDRRLLAAAGADGTLRLWSVASPGHPSLIATVVGADASHPLYVAASSRAGKVPPGAGAGPLAPRWDGPHPPPPPPPGPPLTGPTNTIYSVAFSPDGKTLAAGSADGTVRLWDMRVPGQAQPLGAPLSA